MTWFETLTGFPENSAQQVRENITVDGQTLTSQVNVKVFRYGRLEIPTLAELRERVRASRPKRGKISVREVVAAHRRSEGGFAFSGRFPVQSAGNGLAECHSGKWCGHL